MNQSNRWRIPTSVNLLIAWVCIAASPASADVRLPHVLGNNLVVQRDLPISVWGWADAGEKITVKLAGNEVTTIAGARGKWAVKLPAVPAGGPHQITVSGNNTIRLTNVLVGEVWICSGQSNMVMAVGHSKDAEQEVSAADYPKIRLFTVPRTSSGRLEFDVDGAWQVCKPDTVRDFSAVGYFFGRELHRELAVPIGLICTAWGGSRIEPWTPPAGFAAVPKVRHVLEQIEKANRDHTEALGEYLDRMEAWIPAARRAVAGGEADLPPAPDCPAHPLIKGKYSGPSTMYNGMVHPFIPLAIRGAIWYQGEANCLSRESMMYHEKMKALIYGWRKVWGQGDFPFYFVQLAPFNYNPRYKLGPFALPETWEAQTATLAVPNTGMAVTIDVGNLTNIHPANKQAVGRRLALWALAGTFGREGLVYSGPLYKSMSIEGNKIRIRFDHVGSGLASRDGKPLTWFQIAAADKKFLEARANVDGDTIVVWSEAVTRPVAVRFAWDQQAQPNLINKEGLPASPFRTDNWEAAEAAETNRGKSNG